MVLWGPVAAALRRTAAHGRYKESGRGLICAYRGDLGVGILGLDEELDTLCGGQGGASPENGQQSHRMQARSNPPPRPLRGSDRGQGPCIGMICDDSSTAQSSRGGAAAILPLATVELASLCTRCTICHPQGRGGPGKPPRPSKVPRTSFRSTPARKAGCVASDDPHKRPVGHEALL